MRTLTVTSAIIYTILAASVAFLAGRATSIFYLGDSSLLTTKPLPFIKDAPKPGKMPMNAFLPPPRPIGGKKPPNTKYTSKIFSHVRTASERHADVHLEDDTDGAEQEHHKEMCTMTDTGDRECYIDKFSEEDYAEAKRLMMSNDKQNKGNAYDEDDDDESS